MYDYDKSDGVWSAPIRFDHNTAYDGLPAGWNTDPVDLNSRANPNPSFHTYLAGTDLNGRWITMEATITHLGQNSYNILAAADGYSVSQNFVGLNLVNHQLAPLIYAFPSHHVRFDNVSITGTAIVPESSAGLLAFFGGLIVYSLRTVRSSRCTG